MSSITIALDAMGGDHGASVVVPAALTMLRRDSRLNLILVGDQATLESYLGKNKAKLSNRLTITHASQVVGMDEAPTSALRTKKNSSMRVALNLVKEGKAQACVSAGNTGALLATARFVLKTLPGIDRPAIIRMLPTTDPNTNVRILDLGANVDSTPQNLFQFAVMGSVVASAIDNVPNPKVALLNIGEEEIKGNELVKQTAALLRGCSAINFSGYIEGDKIFTGKAHVIVCDGFVGNIALKVTEGMAKVISTFMRQTFNRNILTRLAGLAAIWVLRSVRKKVDPDRYNGASLIGLQGTVIKSHGSASALAFANAIEAAVQEVKKNVPTCISDQVSSLLQKLS